VSDISYSDLHVGDIVDGKVNRVESYGLFVTIQSSELVCFCTSDRQVVISNGYDMQIIVLGTYSCFKAGYMVIAKKKSGKFYLWPDWSFAMNLR
jgi:rRNA biogenesis protein RRP5